MTTKKKLTRIPSISCPHCGARSLVRTSEQHTSLVREIRFNCEDDECGHSFVAQISIIRTVRPSAKPNPEVRLPFSNPNCTAPRQRPANDDVPTPANDVDPDVPAASIMSG